MSDERPLPSGRTPMQALRARDGDDLRTRATSADAEGDVGSTVVTEAPAPVRLRDAWQLPVLAASLLTIGFGFWVLKAARHAPDPAGLLVASAQLIQEGRLTEAQALLAKANVALAEAEHQDPIVLAQILAARADVEARRPRAQRNNQELIRLYEEAQAHGLALDDERQARRAGALATLGAYDKAFAMLPAAPAVTDDSKQAERVRVLRRKMLGALAERALEGDRALHERLPLELDTWAAAEGTPVDHRAWAAATSAQVRLAAGAHEEALTSLMRLMRRFDAVPADATVTAVLSEWTPRFYALLGRSWIAANEINAAREPLETALLLLPETDDYRPGALAAMAWVDFATGDHELAIQGFDAVIAGAPLPATARSARLWRAESHAALGAAASAALDYNWLLRIGAEVSASPAMMELLESLSGQISASIVEGELGHAVIYATELIDAPSLSLEPRVILLAAEAFNALGRRQLGLGLQDEGSAGDGWLEHGMPELAREAFESIDTAALAAARRHLRKAGSLYERAAAGLQPDGTTRAAWKQAQLSASECFDLGAQPSRALEAYEAFLEETDARDPERARLALQYARVLHAEDRLGDALVAYDDVVRHHAGGPRAATARVNAVDCLVGLERPQEARARLEAIVSGSEGITPEAEAYRESLFALGELLSAMGDHVAAARHLDAAIRRYPNNEQVSVAAFDLAKSHQLLADELDDGLLDTGLRPSRRVALEAERNGHLNEASMAFSLVVDALVHRESTSLDSIEVTLLRSSFVGQADSVCRLGRDNEAVVLLEAIDRRYRDEATSLEALVKLVDVLDRQGETEAGEKAHKRAVLRLRQLPESAFTFPASLHDREAWRVWIDRRPMRTVVQVDMEP